MRPTASRSRRPGAGSAGAKYLANTIECSTGCPAILTSSQIQTAERNSLPGLFYTDLNLSQRINFGEKSTARFFFNVTNVFNKKPLLLPETGLAANSTYSDMLGRQFRVGVRLETK